MIAKSPRRPRQPRKPTTTNRVHFVCFDCRKSFKQRGSSNWDVEVPKRPFPCPECRTPMVRLGRYFKAPPRRAVHQWLKVELLHHFGEMFVGDLRSGISDRCPTLPRAVEYLSTTTATASEVRAALASIRAARSRAPKRP